MANWHLIVCGISHKTSPVSIREDVQISREDIASANAAFGNLEGVLESAIVATCNRVEFYFVSPTQYNPFDIIRKFYTNFRQIDIADLHNYFYTKKNRHTADHLFRVAAGIDSMVIGETQIFGQVKEAYSSSCAVKTSGQVIHRLFHQCFRVGKVIRTGTEMGRGACSVSSAAIEMLRTRLNGVKHPRFLFVGVNQMINLAASNLHRLGYNKFIFINRTIEKAELLANKYNTNSFSLNDLPACIVGADVIISCTGSNEPIINDATINVDRLTNKLIIVDLAVPRDVDISDHFRDRIEILDQEDIKRHVKEQQTRREKAVPQAEEIIERRMDEFVYWFNHMQNEPLYNGLDNLFESIRQQELADIINKLPDELKDDVDRVTRNIVNKLMQIKVRTEQTEKSGKHER